MRISLKSALLAGAFIGLATTGSAFAGTITTVGAISFFGSPTTILSGTIPVTAVTGTSSLSSDGTVTIAASGPGAIVSGSSAGNYAAPITNSSGATYSGNYFSTGLTSNPSVSSGLNVSPNSAGVIDFKFSQQQLYFGLLWGSVDGSSGKQNVLSFYKNGSLVGSLTGAEIAAAAGVPTNGIQTYGGSAYINADISGGYNQVVAGSQIVSFEFAAVTAAPTVVKVPEPGSLLLLGTSMLGLGLILRRRRRA